MNRVSQCNRCGAQGDTPHNDSCRGRKVKVNVLTMAEDYVRAKEQGFSVAPPRSVLRCFDSGWDHGADRYTLVRLTPVGFYQDLPSRSGWTGLYLYMGCNSAPYHPQGIGMTGESIGRPLWGVGQWGGDSRPAHEKPIRWSELPEQVRRAAWDLACDDTARG